MRKSYRLSSVVVEDAGLRRTVQTGETLLWRERVATSRPADLRLLHATFRAEIAKELELILRLSPKMEPIADLRDRCAVAPSRYGYRVFGQRSSMGAMFGPRVSAHIQARTMILL